MGQTLTPSADKVQSKDQAFPDVYQPNNRISYIVGIGASYIANTIYQDPAINRSNNFVIIEEGQKQKTSLTLGIVYTPYLKKIIYEGGHEQLVPHGFSMATFINPVTISKATNTQSFFNIVDFGVGAGYKFANGFLVMGTVEWFSARQPRKWFVDQYKGNNQPYLINNAQQAAIDINDNNIFENKIINTIGFKFCYTFDLVKNYYEAANRDISGGTSTANPSTQTTSGGPGNTKQK